MQIKHLRISYVDSGLIAQGWYWWPVTMDGSVDGAVEGPFNSRQEACEQMNQYLDALETDCHGRAGG